MGFILPFLEQAKFWKMKQSLLNPGFEKGDKMALLQQNEVSVCILGAKLSNSSGPMAQEPSVFAYYQFFNFPPRDTVKDVSETDSFRIV